MGVVSKYCQSNGPHVHQPSRTSGSSPYGPVLAPDYFWPLREGFKEEHIELYQCRATLQGFAYIPLLTVPLVRLFVVLVYGLPKRWSGYYQVASLCYFHTEYRDPPVSSTLIFRDAFVFEKRATSLLVGIFPQKTSTYPTVNGATIGFLGKVHSDQTAVWWSPFTWWCKSKDE